MALSTVHRPGGGVPEYGRVGNPTWTAFEEVVGSLEGGVAVAFASGMAAAAAVFEMLAPGAAVVVPHDCYHGLRLLLRDLASRGRIQARYVDIENTAQTLAACEGAALLWIESPTNPLMAIADIRALAEGARARGVLSAVDNTFATPLLQRPLELGADLVVHSASKALSGHSDVVMGVVVTGDDNLTEPLRQRRTLHGAVPGPMEVFLALRGIRTLHLRVERAQANAAELARRLTAEPKVTNVRYPGLPDWPGHKRATSQMSGFGTMVSFELSGGLDAADRVCAEVELIVHGTSLGGVETLVDRRARWPLEEATPAALLRLSVGCEDVEDLWADLSQAISGSRSSAT